MKLLRMGIAVLLVGLLAGVAYVAQQAEPTGARMTAAAEKFLAGLSPEQRARANLAFDDKERVNYHFIPLQDAQGRSTRKGLPLEAMNAEQKEAALALLRAGTSARGAQKAATIMSLESILHELEKNGKMVRNPAWYFVTVFGKPSAAGKWGWRFEGHHLALNFVVDGGKVVASTPAFFGANPATVKAGPRKGLRTLPEAEDLAWQLFRALDANQQKVARQPANFPEINQGSADPGVGEPKGLPAEQMNERQRKLLAQLLQAYADRMPADVGQAEMARVREGGFDKIHFAFAGGLEPGQPHTYRVHGPTFVVEFLNVQPDSAINPANHIHSCWRSLKNDFGVATE